ncbi:MAG: RluA family pseudouridine synthase [bacterium]
MGDTPNIRERHFPVDQNFDGWRLDVFLANRIGRLSRTRAGDIAKYGDIAIVPARKVKAGARLRQGDVVIVREHLPPERVQDDEVDLIHQDEALVIVSKPAGMLVHEAANIRLNTVGAYLERIGLRGAEPAHRLDRETSGVLVCARHPMFVPMLRDMFASEHPQKTYRAMVVDDDERWKVGTRVTLTNPLGLDPTSELGVRMTHGDLLATTHVTCLRRGKVRHPTLGDVRLADLEVVIETGRQHQIRVHLMMEGTPIAGDKLYGFDDAFFMAICDDPGDPELRARLVFERHALHAWRLTMPHPSTRTPMTFEAELPALWDAVVFES